MMFWEANDVIAAHLGMKKVGSYYRTGWSRLEYDDDAASRRTTRKTTSMPRATLSRGQDGELLTKLAIVAHWFCLQG